MSQPPHALDYRGSSRPPSRSQFLFDHHGNFIAGAVFGSSITLIAALILPWISKDIVEKIAFPHPSIALAFIGVGFPTILFSIIQFFRRRRFPVGILTGTRHGMLTGIGLAITMIGIYLFVLAVLAIGM